ncbi:MAG: hypothetical protein AB8B91_06320, partial [Rubripirellula sp.]
IAGTYADVIREPEKLESYYAKISFTKANRELVRELIATRSPTVEETAAAGELYQQARNQKGQQTVAAEMSFFSMLVAVYVALSQWLSMVWIPSLIAAVATRGGVLNWLFGLTFANRRGEPASRLRIFFRMLIGGLPTLLLLVFVMGSFNGQANDAAILVQLTIFTLVAIAFAKPLGMLHDRIAGTRLVAARA